MAEHDTLLGACCADRTHAGVLSGAVSNLLDTAGVRVEEHNGGLRVAAGRVGDPEGNRPEGSGRNPSAHQADVMTLRNEVGLRAGDHDCLLLAYLRLPVSGE